jgi:hypothetical protein
LYFALVMRSNVVRVATQARKKVSRGDP